MKYVGSDPDGSVGSVDTQAGAGDIDFVLANSACFADEDGELLDQEVLDVGMT